MSEEVKLLPCPFCGAKSILRTKTYSFSTRPNEAYYRKYSIICDGACVVYLGDYMTEAAAIAAWNTRASTSERDKAIARAAFMAGQESCQAVQSWDYCTIRCDLTPDDYLNSEEFKKLVGEK